MRRRAMCGRSGRRRSRSSSRACGRCWNRRRRCRPRCWPNGWVGLARSDGSATTCAGCVPSIAPLTPRTGSPGLLATRRSAICGSRRKVTLEDGTAKLLPVLVITAAHSRFVAARMIPTRKTEDLLLGSWELIQQLGRVPRRLIWDNEPGIGRGPRRAEGVAAFMGTLATKLVLLPPRDPESKGVVERRNGWFETSFMPAVGRSPHRPTSTSSSPTGWAGRTPGWSARSRPRRPI